MRLPNGVEGVGADDRVQGDAGLARARADLARPSLPASVCSSSAPFPGDHRAGLRQAPVEADGVQDERRARGDQPSAAVGPEPAPARPPAARHGAATGIAGRSGRRARAGGRVRRFDERGVGALLRVEERRRARTPDVDVAQDGDGRADGGRRRPEHSGSRAGAAVSHGAARAPATTISPAPSRTAARRWAPRCRASRRTRDQAGPRRRGAEAAGLRHLHHGPAAIAEHGPGRVDGPAPQAGRGDARHAAREASARGERRVEGAVAAVGQRKTRRPPHRPRARDRAPARRRPRGPTACL